jgi:hypothetical protein
MKRPSPWLFYGLEIKMSNEVNATFQGLPSGYTHKLYKCGSGFGVTIISPQGKETDVVGKPDSPITFHSDMSRTYAVGDVRNAIVKETIGDGEDYYRHLHGYSQRTDKYLTACKERIGFIRSESDENYTLDDRWTPFDKVGWDTSDTYIKKTEDGYVVAYQIRTDIDAFHENRYFFDRHPGIKGFRDALMIDGIETKFAINTLKEEFTCHECGHHVHWLDIAGSLQDKIDCLKERYCGC